VIILRIEDVDGTVAEISNKKIVGEFSKSGRSDRKSPRRIKRSAGGDSLHQVSVQVELVDKPVAWASDVIMLGGVLQRERHEQMVVENLHIERRKAGRHRRIGKAVDLFEVAIEDIHRSVPEICRVQESAVVGLTDRQPFIDGPATALRIIDGQDGAATVYCWVKPRNSAVFSREDKGRGGCHPAAGDVKSGSRGIEYLACRARWRGLAWRRRHLDRTVSCNRRRGSRAIVDRYHASTVVRNPEGTCCTGRNTPRIDQIRINGRGGNGAV